MKSRDTGTVSAILLPMLAVTAVVSGCNFRNEAADNLAPPPPRATPAPAPGTPSATPTPHADESTQSPSYEVAISTAVGNHERSLDGCRDLARDQRRDCISKADATYLQEKASAARGRSP